MTHSSHTTSHRPTAGCSAEGTTRRSIHMLDDQRLVLAESGHDEPQLLAEDRGAATYAYRGYRFTITHDKVGWWCHHGATRPGHPVALCHEAGWFTYRRARIVRKLARAIDRSERDHGRLLATQGGARSGWGGGFGS